MNHQEEVDRFIAVDEAGNELTIICLQTMIESKLLDGSTSRINRLKEFITIPGDRLNVIDSESFKIVTTNQIVRKF